MSQIATFYFNDEMERVHVKKCFILFVPWESDLTQQEIVSEPNLVLHGEDHSKTRIFFSLRLFCKQRVTSKEYEQQDCLSWARTPFTFRKRTDEEQQSGFLLRLKVKQGAFDFRKVDKRLIRIQVDASNASGQLLNAATTQFFQLFPRKRNTDLISVGNKEVIIPSQWQITALHNINNANNIATENPGLVSDDHPDELLTTLQLLNQVHDDLETHTDDGFATSTSIQVHEDSYSGEQIPPSSEDSEQDYSHYTLSLMHEEYTDNSQYMVLYNGNAEVVGNFRALNFYKASDINIKEDVRLLMEDHDPRDVLLKIDGVSYKFKPGTTHSTQRRFVGYIAQQIESVVPEAVQLIDGILHVDYESLIPYLSESIKTNYNDINNMKNEQQHIKAVVDMLYDDFLQRDRPPRERYSTTSTTKQSQACTTQRVLLAVLSIVFTVSAVMIGVYFVVDYSVPIKDLTPSTPSPTTPLPSNNPLPSSTPLPNLAPIVIVVPVPVKDPVREALEDLYVSTNGDNWRSMNVQWLSDAPICEWTGIACNEDDQVTGISLYYTNLHGPLPDSIGNLSALESLTLPGNNLTGTIPSSIMQLKNLTILRLDQNPYLSGTIPDLPPLIIEFFASQCNLSGTIPPSISNLTQLFSLQLYQNQLSGTIPPLPDTLVAINLNNNRLEGSLPTLTHKSSIFFDAANNSLTGTLENLANVKITKLSISNNNFTGEVVLFDISITNELKISGNMFTSFNKSTKQPYALYKEDCDASGNAFRCPMPAWFKKVCKATCTK